MPRPTLSPAAVESFRRRLSDVALRRFAEDGYSGVTLRGLADELGCSRATPYRYFRSKQDIFDGVRAHAYERFAAALELSAVGEPAPVERVRRMMTAYAQFALDEPHAYRIMFELHQPAGLEIPAEYLAKRLRAWEIWRAQVGSAVETGHFRGDPDVLAHVFWASVHGLVALHLAGKLVLGLELPELVTPVIEGMLRSHLATRATEGKPTP